MFYIFIWEYISVSPPEKCYIIEFISGKAVFLRNVVNLKCYVCSPPPPHFVLSCCVVQEVPEVSWTHWKSFSQIRCMCILLNKVNYLHELYGHAVESRVPLNFLGWGGVNYRNQSSFILINFYILICKFSILNINYESHMLNSLALCAL